jgi:hypothetical protein
MNKKLAVVLVIVAFLAGAIGGATGTNYFWKRFMNTFYSTSLAEEIGTDVVLLNQLRANNVTNAADFLEIRLNGSLVGLGVYLQNIPESRRDPTQVGILGQAKEYRSKFPYKDSFPLGDQMISNAFSLVNMKTNK